MYNMSLYQAELLKSKVNIIRPFQQQIALVAPPVLFQVLFFFPPARLLSRDHVVLSIACGIGCRDVTT